MTGQAKGYLALLCTLPCALVLLGISFIPRLSNFLMIPPFWKMVFAVRFNVDTNSG